MIIHLQEIVNIFYNNNPIKSTTISVPINSTFVLTQQSAEYVTKQK